MSIHADLLDALADRIDRSSETTAKPVVPEGIKEHPLDEITDIKEIERPAIPTDKLGLVDNSELKDVEIGTRNILAVYDQATPSELEFWSKWYAHAQTDVKKLADKYSMPFGLTAAVVAITSPGNKWAMNLRAAERAIRLAADLIGNPEHQELEKEIIQVQKEMTQGPTPERAQELKKLFKDLVGRYKRLGQQRGLSINTYPLNIRKAVQVIDSEDPAAWVTGPKVQPFMAALLDPHKVTEKMVLDGHALNIWAGIKRPLKEAIDAPERSVLRENILTSYRNVAKARNTNTRALQAVTWYIWKAVYNPQQPVLDEEDMAEIKAA